ncbi:MAG: hypothetical protein RR145_03645 [Oscillospiraceae bacterium]
MAKSLYIGSNSNGCKIVVDGNEITDIMSYILEENATGATLTLVLSITDKIEVQQ